MSASMTAWLIIVLGYLLPLDHVVLAPGAGAWRPPPGSSCPFGPRAGWLVMVLLLGPLGWLLFAHKQLIRRRGRNRAGIKT